MSDIIAPTPEQIAKGSYEAPLKDRTTNRTAYRRRSPLETLWDREEIDYAQHQAAEKLTKHMMGSLGVKVRQSDDHTPTNSDTEFPRTYHAQKVAEAKAAVLPREWSALERMIMETETLETIGRKWRSVSRREIARAQGLSLVSTGLERIARLWGFCNANAA